MIESQKYVVVKGKAGMGNRMLCAVSGILYGRLAKRKTLVSWRDGTYSENGENVFERFFDAPHASDDEIPNADSVMPELWRGHLGVSLSEMFDQYDPAGHNSGTIHRKYSIDPKRLSYDEDIVVFWHFTHRAEALRQNLNRFLPDYKNLGITQILAKALKEELVLQPRIRDRIESFRSEKMNGRVIGLHIRFSDMRTNIRTYERALERILKNEPYSSVFLATDNRAIAERFWNRYRNVFSAEKWFPDEQQSMHQNASCPDRIENGVEALVDMYLLAHCDYLIYPGGSTFSRISRLLSDLPPQRVVDTERFNPAVRARLLVRHLQK